MSLSTVEQVGCVQRAGAKTDINHGTSKSESHMQTENKDQKHITGHNAVLACITRTGTKPLTEAGTQGSVDVSLQHGMPFK